MYERIIFKDKYPDILATIENGQYGQAINYLTKWWYPGNHMVVESPPWGARDSTYRSGEFILSWNSNLGYVALQREVKDTTMV